MSVKIVIPSRFGSSRLEGKPLLDIHGKPMVLHVVDRCIEAGVLSENIYIATDDYRIVAALGDCEVKVVMTSNKHNSGTDRINEVVRKYDWSDDDVVINVQGDEPMIPSSLIRNIVQFSLDNPHFEITTAVTTLKSNQEFNNPNIVKAIVGSDNRALYFTRSPAPMDRDNPGCFKLAKRHIGIYAYQVSALKKFCGYAEDLLEKTEKLEQLRALSHGMSIGAITFEENIPHGVDTVSDYEYIIELMERCGEENS
ncbi:3-deoxy-manno-octulosonate cytidylyltransferase [Vibrio chagasii]|nr:3-deoxy-manno-octulosonate cytidylyltransferase [Vibrio chagasii]CAH6806339.1 3-deoxy-manno-octulosonate cytidylyltransferase [Vibrio chagasii]CAH6904391.1 3-deoxy-manno-octulosonate cytidylyltransferase [Vibrio chagasii]CAH6940971.1 3-deoxy-manno-octulosonate cytidylyltransferase [Vibrio chagasii]CAH6957186.1 3-deoxy-manno-octulosonate cytidylyltransferase [Vibrio chagasii]